MNKIGAYKVYAEANWPTMATGNSACFDVSACLINGELVNCATSYNEQTGRTIVDGKFTMFSGERALIPTGLIFDIPLGYSLRIHPRSGLSYKKGVSLSNCVGVIDSDYVDQTYVSLINHSDVTFVVEHGDRIAQLELVKIELMIFTDLKQPPEVKTNRVGGFGSTGLTT